MDTRTYGVPAAKLDWLVKARATPRTTCTHTTRDIAFDGRTSKSGLASLGLALVSSMFDVSFFFEKFLHVSLPRIFAAAALCSSPYLAENARPNSEGTRSLAARPGRQLATLVLRAPARRPRAPAAAPLHRCSGTPAPLLAIPTTLSAWCRSPTGSSSSGAN